MRKGIVYIIIIILSMLFTGCENNNNSTINDTGAYEEEEVEYMDTGFIGMNWAEKTTEIKPLNQMKKIFCDFSGGYSYEFGGTIAIDIEKKELYVNYYYTQINDYTEPTYMLSDSEIEEFLSIIETFKIQEWKEEYVPEVYKERDLTFHLWEIYMQNEDNTVEKHWGVVETFYSEEIKLLNCDEFRAAMIEFVNNLDIGFSRIPIVEGPLRTSSLEIAKRIKPLEQAKKVVCIFLKEDIDSEEKVIAIDIENKELYIDYDINKIDYVEPTCILNDSDIEEFLNIIKTYKIQEWEYQYWFEEENSIQYVPYHAWTIYIENEDKTVEKHMGITNTFNHEGVKPPNYDEFKAAMEEFANKCVNREE